MNGMALVNRARQSISPDCRPVESRTACRGLSPLRDAAIRLFALCLMLPAGACSLSFPMASLRDDDGPTASLETTTRVLSPSLDAEDWHRAKAALAKALDPKANGADVAWSNPKSGAKGSFVAAEAAFERDARLCRAFTAKVTAPKHPVQDITGSACRNRDGDWVLVEVKDAKQG